MPRGTYEPDVVVETGNLTEEEWLDYRRGGIGGSDVSIIFGVSHFRCNRELYYDKLGIKPLREEEDETWLNKAVRIHERYGDKAMEVLNERPFELCDISGFGFKTVDNIARKIKCKPNDKMRIKAAAKHVIGEMKSEGHVYMDQQELRDKCFDLLNDDLKNISVTHEEIRECLIELIRAKTLVNNNVKRRCLYWVKL